MPPMYPADLIVMALPLESQGVFEAAGVPVLYTGIGKVNAAHALTRRLCEYRHAAQPLPRVVNFGTAGSRRHPAGRLIECTAFLQREVAHRVRMKYAAKLKFIADESFDEGTHIDRILRSDKVAQDLGDE